MSTKHIQISNKTGQDRTRPDKLAKEKHHLRKKIIKLTKGDLRIHSVEEFRIKTKNK